MSHSFSAGNRIQLGEDNHLCHMEKTCNAAVSAQETLKLALDEAAEGAESNVLLHCKLMEQNVASPQPGLDKPVEGWVLGDLYWIIWHWAPVYVSPAEGPTRFGSPH